MLSAIVDLMTSDGGFVCFMGGIGVLGLSCWMLLVKPEQKKASNESSYLEWSKRTQQRNS